MQVTLRIEGSLSVDISDLELYREIGDFRPEHMLTTAQRAKLTEAEERHLLALGRWSYGRGYDGLMVTQLELETED